MPKRAKSTADDFLATLDGEFRDLEAENELLRRELRRVLALKGDTKPPKFKPTYRARKGTFRRYVIIPDTQVRPGVPTEHISWAARYIAEKRPDVIVALGDWWDMPSLSSYDKGKRSFEGRRYKADVDAGNAAMELLMEPIRKARGYSPEMHFLIGNHEQRMERTLEVDPWLEGLIGYENLALDGWTVHPFLETVELDGIIFSHYFKARNSRFAVGGTAHNLLAKVGKSCIQGHRQGIDSAMRHLPDGTQQRALIAGSFYQHQEAYRLQDSAEWRGIVVLNEVQNGMWDQLEISLDYLRRKYGR